MALSTLLMQELCKRLTPGVRIASMGYPDLIAPPKEIERILGAKFHGLKYRKDSEDIGKWHGVEHKIPDAHSFFELQGATLDVYDIAEHRGGEIPSDLNEVGMGISYTRGGIHACYDLVLDVGTLEHCFAIGQAAISMSGLLKQCEFILHENPFNSGNHGLYNMNPTWYADFYGQRGFKLHECWLAPRGEEPIKNIERTTRFNYQGPEANVIAIAERLEVLPIEFVVQSKYKKMIQKALPDSGDLEMATTAQGR